MTVVMVLAYNAQRASEWIRTQRARGATATFRYLYSEEQVRGLRGCGYVATAGWQGRGADHRLASRNADLARALAAFGLVDVSRAYRGCELDTDWDGNCPIHPRGCPLPEASPTASTPAAGQAP